MGSLLGQQQPYQPQAGFSYDPKQVDKLEGGGLQAPTIDPVMVAATSMIPYFGPTGAANNLLRQIIANQITSGLGDRFHRASQYLPKASTEDVNDLSGLTNKSLDLATGMNTPADYGDRIRQMYVASRYPNMSGNDYKFLDPSYGDNWDKFVYKAGDIMDKLFKSPVASAAESAAE